MSCGVSMSMSLHHLFLQTGLILKRQTKLFQTSIDAITSFVNIFFTKSGRNTPIKHEYTRV